MSTASRRRGNEAGSGGVDCTRHRECEGDESCIENQRTTLVVRLKMSDSPKSGLQWYWGGREGSSLGVSSPVATPTLRDHQGDDAEETTRTPRSSSSAQESEAAELVLEQLDEQWFCDNVVRWPSSQPGSPPGVIDKDVATSPFRPRREFLPSGLSRRLSDGDHHLKRYLDSRDQTPRRRILEAEDQHHRRFSEISNAESSSLPEIPTKFEDQSRFCNEASAMEGFSPLAQGPLMGVTEDEEMENDLFAKMLASRPAKMTAINPGLFSLNPLQENQSSIAPYSLPIKRKPQPRPRRRLKGTKSLTDLEYEELRGFKDLGFEVSKGDLTPHVVRMFPGLQRQGIPPYNSPQRYGDRESQTNAMLPDVLWPRRPDSPLLNAPSLDPSIDMKGQLKSWASEMASIVSIEC